MGNSKVVFNGETLMDISNDTVTPDTLAEGVTAHDSSGELIVGTLSLGGINNKLNNHEKRITNLEKGLPDDNFLTDSTVAYSETVPTNALPYAELEMIGGMSYRVNIGTEEEPIYELQHSPVTELKFAGRNLIDGNVFANNFVELAEATKDIAMKTVSYAVSKISGKRIFEFSELDPNSVYTIMLYGINSGETAKQTNLYVLYSDESKGELNFKTAGVESYCIYTTKQGVSPVAIVGTWKQGTVTLYYEKCGIFEGELTESDFAPYWRDVFPIPEAIQSLNGYGLGIDNSAYNHVDFANRQFLKSVKKVVFDENSNPEFRSINSHGVANFLFANSDNLTKGVICDKLPTQTTTASEATDEGIFLATLGIYVRLFSTTASNLSEFKAWLSQNPLEVVYRLKDSEVIDISDILTEDNLISVEGGGTVTMENDHGHAVPSEITYMLKGE